MRRSRTMILSAGTAFLVSGLVAGALAASAGASYHLMRISEIHQGASAGTEDYVELQMFEPGQTLVGGRHIVTYDGGGNVYDDNLIPTNVANGQSQRTILMANTDTIGTTPDFIADVGVNVIAPAGTVCFTDTVLSTGIDCVSYGSPMTLPSPLPSPVGASAPGLGSNQSLERKISGGSCATALDAGDDTNNSAADFALAAGSPRNNATAPTEALCAPEPGTKSKKCKKKGKQKGKAGAGAAKKKCKRKKKKGK